MNTASRPMYRWNTWLCTQDVQAPKVYLPSLTRGTDDNNQAIEEPDDANVSRPVLKPSGRSDSVA
jgi:hypothetical protein